MTKAEVRRWRSRDERRNESPRGERRGPSRLGWRLVALSTSLQILVALALLVAIWPRLTSSPIHAQTRPLYRAASRVSRATSWVAVGGMTGGAVTFELVDTFAKG